jgi:DNA-binding transcriptional ArsR family regulator
MLSSAHQQCFKTIGNSRRMEIMFLLLERSMNVTELAKKMKVEQSVISHHLKHLKNCFYVKVSIKGKERLYSVNKKTVVPLFKLINNHVEEYCSHHSHSNCCND